jgi:hypothetical protein
VPTTRSSRDPDEDSVTRAERVDEPTEDEQPVPEFEGSEEEPQDPGL